MVERPCLRPVTEPFVEPRVWTAARFFISSASELRRPCAGFPPHNSALVQHTTNWFARPASIGLGGAGL